jgi:excisionase family DNA binding protein
MDEDDTTYTVSEVAQKLKVKASTVYSWIRKGLLKCKRVRQAD